MVGTCFGFEINSELPFAYLREGVGDPLEVSESSIERVGRDDQLLIAWTPVPELPFHARLYSDGSHYRLWIDGGGWFSIDPKRQRIVVPQGRNPVRTEERLWGIPAILAFLARGDLPLHAAAVEVDGHAILLAAPRMFGKTTLAAAFVRSGYRLLSEDVSCVRLSSRTPSVIAGPAALRVRRDVADRLDLPSVRVVAETEERVHFAIDEARRGDCTPVAIRAIALLKPSADGLLLERAGIPDAIRDLWALSFRVPTDADRARCFKGVSDVGASVPVWNLSHPHGLEDLAATVERIASDV
jgi:hypothetical protein